MSAWLLLTSIINDNIFYSTKEFMKLPWLFTFISYCCIFQALKFADRKIFIIRTEAIENFMNQLQSNGDVYCYTINKIQCDPLWKRRQSQAFHIALSYFVLKRFWAIVEVTISN